MKEIVVVFSFHELTIHAAVRRLLITAKSQREKVLKRIIKQMLFNYRIWINFWNILDIKRAETCFMFLFQTFLFISFKTQTGITSSSINLCSQDASSTGSFDLLFCLLREIFRLHDDGEFWAMSVSQEFVVTLERWEKKLISFTFASLSCLQFRRRVI